MESFTAEGKDFEGNKKWKSIGKLGDVDSRPWTMKKKDSSDGLSGEAHSN